MVTLAQIQALPPEVLATRDEVAIAAALSAGRTKVVQRLGGIGTVLEVLGPTDGAALLDQLQATTTTVPALKWAWVLVDRGELDFGSASTRAMIDVLVPEPARTALKAVAEVPDPVDPFAVRRLIWADNGDCLL